MGNGTVVKIEARRILFIRRSWVVLGREVVQDERALIEVLEKWWVRRINDKENVVSLFTKG